jgi:hypothetical protein
MNSWKLGQPRYRQVVDAAERVGEPSFGIDVIELGGGDQGVDRGRPPLFFNKWTVSSARHPLIPEFPHGLVRF